MRAFCIIILSIFCLSGCEKENIPVKTKKSPIPVVRQRCMLKCKIILKKNGLSLTASGNSKIAIGLSPEGYVCLNECQCHGLDSLLSLKSITKEEYSKSSEGNLCDKFKKGKSSGEFKGIRNVYAEILEKKS